MHAENIRKAHVDEWQTPNLGEGRLLRKTNYVIPPDSGDSSSSSENSENDMPLARLAQRCRNKRDNSEDEGSIPKVELAKLTRLQVRGSDSESDSDLVSDSSVHSRPSGNQTYSDTPESIKCEGNNIHASLSEHQNHPLTFWKSQLHASLRMIILYSHLHTIAEVILR